jgi:glycine oxidase
MTTSTDVIVVGAGIVGLSAALRLAEAGCSVKVIDKGKAGAESSTAGAGLIMPQAETDPPGGDAPAEGMVDDTLLAACLAGRDLYAEFIHDVRAQSNIKVNFRLNGVLSLAMNEAEVKRLERRVSWQTGIDLEARMLGKGELESMAPGARAMAAAVFPRDGYVDNQALMPALTQAVRAKADLVEESTVQSVAVEGNRVLGVDTLRGRHESRHVVLAAGAWSEPLIPADEPAPRIRPSRGQMILMEAAGAPEHGVIAGSWYVVPRSGGRVLLGSTVQDAGFDKSVPEESVTEIQKGVELFLPAAREWKRLRAWSGLRPRAASGKPLIGPGRHDGLWLATGHFRNGLLLAPLTAAWLVRGIVHGAIPPEAEPFSPTAAR